MVDGDLARVFELGAPASSERLIAMKKCHDAGLMASINPIPLLPFPSDDRSGIERAITMARRHGADYMLAGSLMLFGEGPGDCKIYCN